MRNAGRVCGAGLLSKHATVIADCIFAPPLFHVCWVHAWLREDGAHASKLSLSNEQLHIIVVYVIVVVRIMTLAASIAISYWFLLFLLLWSYTWWQW